MLKNIIFALLSFVALGNSPAVLAADPPSAEAGFVQATPATPDRETVKEADKQPSNNTRPINDNHVDYRYCLELKTNLEIMQCRYKKK